MEGWEGSVSSHHAGLTGSPVIHSTGDWHFWEQHTQTHCHQLIQHLMLVPIPKPRIYKSTCQGANSFSSPRGFVTRSLATIPSAACLPLEMALSTAIRKTLPKRFTVWSHTNPGDSVGLPGKQSVPKGLAMPRGHGKY